MRYFVLSFFFAVILFSNGICQDTLYVTLNSRNCMPCYGLLQSFFEENDVTCTVVGLSLADTSDIEGFKDKMMADHLLNFCDTILYVDSYRQDYFLIPLKNKMFKRVNSYLNQPSPSLVLINERREINFLPAKSLNGAEAIRKLLTGHID